MADPTKAKAPEDAAPKAKAKANVDTADAWARRRPGQMHGETHYLLTGPRESPKLAVCVSGIGGLHIYFDAMEPALVAQGFKVLRYDLWGRGWSGPAPGHARSKPPGCCGGCVPLEEDPYGLDSHVEQLHGLLTGLNLIQEDGGASGGDDEPKDPHRLSMSVSRQQRDIDASLSSSVSSVSGSGAAAPSSYPQTWPPQQSSRAAAVAAAAAATTATTTTATATTTAAAATKNTSTIRGGAAGGGVGGLPSVPETAEVTAPADATPVRQVHVIGHSMGGAIAVGFADRHPELVVSLTLLTPAGLMDPGQFRLLRALPCCIQRVVQASLRRHVGNAVRNDFLVHNTPLEERVLEQVYAHLKHNPTAHEAFFRCVLAFPLSGLEDAVQRVAATRVPTLLIWALHDRVLPFEPHYGRWKALLKTGNNVRYEVIEDACHGFPLERPERTNQIVLRFLKNPPTFLPTAVLHNLQSQPPTITI